MFGKLIEILLGAKSGALSGVLIVAGAVVTVSSGNGVTTVTIEHPSPSPAVETSAEPKPSPLEDAEEAKERDEKKHEDKERNAPAPESCADEAKARAEALQKVHEGFTRFHTQIEHLRSERRTERGLETLKKADELIKEIAEKAERVLHEMGRCHDEDNDDEDADEDEDEATDEDAAKGEDEVTTSTFDEADASSMQRVAERALAAMETVYNLAKSAADATPTPKPTPKTTEKPKAAEKPKATPKPARTPSCDDRLYENKRKMIAAFETFHTNNDKLYYAIKRRATEATVKTVLENDKLMHSTYESAKTEILSSGCAGDLGAAAAARAAATFERAWLSSAAAAGSDRR